MVLTFQARAQSSTMAFEYRGGMVPLDLTQIDQAAPADPTGYRIVKATLPGTDSIFMPTVLSTKKSLVKYPEELSSNHYALKYSLGFKSKAYQIIQRYPDGQRKAIFYLDKKGRLHDYFIVQDQDGNFVHIGKYRRGKPARGWGLDDYKKLASKGPKDENNLDGIYASVTRYGSLYFKLGNDKSCRYYGYREDGTYVNHHGYWKIEQNFLILNTANEDGTVGRELRRFVSFDEGIFIEINSLGYWDPGFRFEKR